MVIKQVTKGVFDLFWDNGWESWARVKRDQGKLSVVAGEKPPKPVLVIAESRLVGRRPNQG